MGIKNLLKFLRDKYPECIINSHIVKFARKKMALDVSSWIYKYKSTLEDNWMNGFYSLISSFRRYRIHVIFVFDGKPPEEKDITKSKRHDIKLKAVSNLENINSEIEAYEKTSIITPFLHDTMKKILISEEKSSGGTPPRPSLLHAPHAGPSPEPEPDLLGDELLGDSEIDLLFDIEKIREKRNRMSREIVNISKEDILAIKTLLTLFGIPYIQADGEAEALCSWFCKNGKVDGVISLDSDVLVYGCPLFVNKYELNGNITFIELPNLLQAMELSFEEFRDFTILCGTDYNPNITRVGPVSAFKLIQKHHSIEEIESTEKYDCSILNYQRGRELFSYIPPAEVPTDLPFWEVFLDLKKAQEFLEEKKIRYFPDSFEEFWGPTKVEFATE